MNSLNENNDITSRDIILLASMLAVVLLTLVGILFSFDKSVCENIWNAIAQSDTVQCFLSLWSKIL